LATRFNKRTYYLVNSSFWLGKSNWISFNISALAENSDFKIVTRLGLSKAHHKIPHRRKSGRGPGLGEVPKILGFPFNICAKAGANDFQFGMQLGFAKAHHKIIRRGKIGRGLGLEKLLNIWGSPLIFLQRPRCHLSVSRASR